MNLLLVILTGIIMIVLAIIPLCLGVYFVRKMKNNKIHHNLKTQELTSRYFIWMLIFTICYLGLLLLFQLLAPETSWIRVVLIITFPYFIGKMRVVKKVQANAFDEREEILMLKVWRNAGQVSVVSAFISGLFFNGKILTMNTEDALLIPVAVFGLSYYLAGWYYFRKHEKELEMENEK